MSVLICCMLLFDSPKILPYGISIQQERTLFAKDEKVIVTVRVGNNAARELKVKYLPNILTPIKVFKDGTLLEQNKTFAEKAMFSNIEFIRLNGHIDRRIDLTLLYPQMVEGGEFDVLFQNDNFDIKAKSIKVSTLDLPDLHATFRLKTSMGDIDMQLYPAEAPNHAANFAILVAEGFYKDMIFHRVARGFVIQTGDPKGDGTGGSGYTLDVEWSPFVKHRKYAVGMARTDERDSADSQFYICLDHVKQLNKDYTVFGNVIKGQEVVDAIGLVGTTGAYGNPPSKPFEDVHLYNIEMIPANP